MSIEKWVKVEQRALWHELQEAIGSAIDRAWSIRASHIAVRVIGAAQLVGPTEQGAVPWSLVAGGVYDAVLTAGGVEFEPLSAEEYARCDELMTRRVRDSVSAAMYRERYAATVEHIGNDTAWLSQEAERLTQLN